MATSVSSSLKARLRNGDTLYGLFFDSFSPTIAEISGHAGYNFVVIDMDHDRPIAAVDGLDCIMIGPTDLSANMGYIRDPGNENAVKMVQTVEKAVLGMKPKGDKSVYLAGFAMPHDEPSELKKRGYHMVCGAVDILLYRDAAVKDVLKFKSSV